MAQHIELQNFLPFRLNRAATVLSRRLSEIYSGTYGIDIPQWRVLATLGHETTCTAQAIVAATYTHKSTISRAVSKLTNSGFIESFSSDTDKREVLLRFTPKGQKLYEELVPLVLAVEADVIASLGQEQHLKLSDSIANLEHALGMGGAGVKRP